MKKLAHASLILPLLSGCFLYDCGYTRNDDTAIYKTDAANKMPITYSLKFTSKNDLWGSPDHNSIRTKIEETLRETALFSEVEYEDSPTEGYHIEFTYRGSGKMSSDILPTAICCIDILLVIPLAVYDSADLSAIFYLNGKPIWSTAHTEKCRYVTGLCVLPVGIVLNSWSVWRSIEYNIVRSTVNDLTREHIRRYLDPSSVELTNPEDVGESDAQP